MKRIEKSYTELNWEDVDFESGNWTWSRGGHPLSDDDYSIKHIDAIDTTMVVETRYAMPKCISEMLQLQRKFGADEAIRKVKIALRIS